MLSKMEFNRKRILLFVISCIIGLSIFYPLAKLVMGKNFLPIILGYPYSIYGYGVPDNELENLELFLYYDDTRDSNSNWIMPSYVDLPSYLPTLAQKEYCITRIIYDVHVNDNVGLIPKTVNREIRPNKAYVFDDLCRSENTYRESMSAATKVPRYGRSIRSSVDEMLNKDIDPSYYFPLDYRILDVYTWVEISYENTDGNIVIMNLVPKIVGYVYSSDWDTTVQISQEFSKELGHDVARVQVIFQQPLAYRVLTAVLIFSLFVFIFLLVLVDSIPSLLEVALGILLGLWGVQDILVPENITWPTIIDPLILTLYVFLAFMVFVSVLGRRLWKIFGDHSKIKNNDKTEFYLPE